MAEAIAPPLPATLQDLLASGYDALVLRTEKRNEAILRGRLALEQHAALKIEAGRELVRLEELSKKVGRLESRCYVSAKHLEFLKLAMGSA